MFLLPTLTIDWALLRDLHWTCKTKGSNLNTESPFKNWSPAIWKWNKQNCGENCKISKYYNWITATNNYFFKSRIIFEYRYIYIYQKDKIGSDCCNGNKLMGNCFCRQNRSIHKYSLISQYMYFLYYNIIPTNYM